MSNPTQIPPNYGIFQAGLFLLLEVQKPPFWFLLDDDSMMINLKGCRSSPESKPKPVKYLDRAWYHLWLCFRKCRGYKSATSNLYLGKWVELVNQPVKNAGWTFKVVQGIAAFFPCVFFPPPLQAKFRSQGRKGLTFLMSYRDTLKPSKELQGGPKTSYKKVITPLIGDPFYPNYPFIYRAIGFITIEGYKGQFNKDLLSSRCHPSGKVFPPSSSLVAHETPAPARLQKDMT